MLRGAVLVVTGEDTTADLVIEELNLCKVPVVRFDLADFPHSVAATAHYGGQTFAGALETHSRRADLSAVRAIYYRRPTSPSFEGLSPQEALFSKDQARFGLGGILAALPGCRQVNHPRLQMAAEYKPAQLAAASDLGFEVPPTIVTNRPEDARLFVEEHGIAVYKPLWSTDYEEDGEARTIWVRAVSADELDESVSATAHLFQARVDKAADVRVTVVGDKVFCVRIESPLTDWRENYNLIESYSVVEPPDGLSELLARYLERFGLAYGCFDFGIDALDGIWWWYECNPTGEWGWIEAETGLPIARAEQLMTSGDLRSTEWRRALESVPREVFLAQFFRQSSASDGSSRWQPVVAVDPNPDDRLAEIYSDESLVTQLDGAVRPEDVAGPTSGVPTSSATMPSLVMRMWENLLVEDDSLVAEVGTGTGYSTALACERLGSDRVTSIDVDPTVISRAREALASAGYHPMLETADGLDGLPKPPDAGCDRVVAACSLRHVPRSWISSTRPGGRILLTLSGWLSAFALARLEVKGDGSAEGWLLDDPASFMPARRHAPPGITDIRTGGPNEIESGTSLSDSLLNNHPGRLLVQLAVPNAQHATGADEMGLPLAYLVDVVTGSYAVVSGASGTVVQGGPVRMWDAVERAVLAWRDSGSPGVEAFRITVTSEGQFIGFAAVPDLWRLPEA